MRLLAPADVSAGFRAACHAELRALKPGNVHIHAGGHGMEVQHFQAAAEAAARFIADPGLQFGERIHAAVDASMTAAGCNTNLGIILLCAPLAAAAVLDAEPQPLRQRVALVLASLDMHDANEVYAAIRRANPGGLGRSARADVAEAPTIPLREAMAIAAPHDRIAANYVSGLRDIFDDHLPTLIRIRRAAAADMPPSAPVVVSTLFMSLLARFPDSHIRRKHGTETTSHVMRLAAAASHVWKPIVSAESQPELLSLDALLKEHGWNPGTTADFVVATVFAADIESNCTY